VEDLQDRHHAPSTKGEWRSTACRLLVEGQDAWSRCVVKMRGQDAWSGCLVNGVRQQTVGQGAWSRCLVRWPRLLTYRGPTRGHQWVWAWPTKVTSQTNPRLVRVGIVTRLFTGEVASARDDAFAKLEVAVFADVRVALLLQAGASLARQDAAEAVPCKHSVAKHGTDACARAGVRDTQRCHRHHDVTKTWPGLAACLRLGGPRTCAMLSWAAARKARKAFTFQQGYSILL